MAIAIINNAVSKLAINEFCSKLTRFTLFRFRHRVKRKNVEVNIATDNPTQNKMNLKLSQFI